MRCAVAAFLLYGCQPGSALQLDPPWPGDEPAVIVVTRPSGEVLSAQIVAPGPVRRLAIPAPSEIVLYARTFPILREVPIETCVLLIGDGDPLGAPDAAWRSEPTSAEGAVDLTVEAEPRSFGLGLSGCSLPPPSCDVLPRLVDVPPAHEKLTAVAVLDEDVVLLGGGARAGDDQRTLILRMTGAGFEEVGPFDAIVGRSSGLDRDGDTVIGGTDDVIYRLDETGGLIESATVAFAVFQLDTGVDGTTILLSATGEMARVRPGRITPEPLVAPSYAVVEIAPKVAVHAADRILLGGPDHRLYLYDGATWSRTTSDDYPEFEAIAIDSDRLLLAADDSALMVFDDVEGWRSVGRPFAFSNAITAAALGDGRFLIVGQSGRTVFWNSAELCEIPTATDRNLDDIEVSPNGDFAIVVGEHAGAQTPPAVLRMTLPPR